MKIYNRKIQSYNIDKYVKKQYTNKTVQPGR